MWYLWCDADEQIKKISRRRPAGCRGLLQWRKWRFVVNTLRTWQNGRLIADDIFKCIFLNENVSIAIKVSLKFVPKGPINNFPALVQIMTWRRPGGRPSSEPMMVSLPTHICVTRPQWVNTLRTWQYGRHLQTIFSNSVSWMRFILFRFKFHWSLSIRVQMQLILNHHWFR